MSHTIIITTPPTDGRVAGGADIKIIVEYAPDHGLTPEQEHRNIEKIERQAERLYSKLQERLAAPDDGE